MSEPKPRTGPGIGAKSERRERCSTGEGQGRTTFSNLYRHWFSHGINSICSRRCSLGLYNLGPVGVSMSRCGLPRARAGAPETSKCGKSCATQSPPCWVRAFLREDMMTVVETSVHEFASVSLKNDHRCQRAMANHESRKWTGSVSYLPGKYAVKSQSPKHVISRSSYVRNHHHHREYECQSQLDH